MTLPPPLPRSIEEDDLVKGFREMRRRARMHDIDWTDHPLAKAGSRNKPSLEANARRMREHHALKRLTK